MTLGPPRLERLLSGPLDASVASARRLSTFVVEASEGDVRPPFALQIPPGALGRFVRPPLKGPLFSFLDIFSRGVRNVRPPSPGKASVGPFGRFFGLCQASLDLDIFSSGVRR